MSKSIGNSSPLQNVYPRTLAALQAHGHQAMAVDFFLEPHFFPMFLRQKKMPIFIQEICQYEWIEHSLNEFSPLVSLEAGELLFLHPATEVLLLTAPIPGSPIQSAGLWVLFPAGPRAEKLSPIGSKLIELLQEDLRWTKRSLTEFILSEYPKTKLLSPGVEETLEQFLSIGLIGLRSHPPQGNK